MRTLPEREILDICKVATTKIWRYKDNVNGDWEDRIVGSYKSLCKRNKIFANNVHLFDFHRCIDGMYHDDFNDNEFQQHLIKEICTFVTVDYYFTIPYLYNFPTDLPVGYCTSVKFEDLPKKVQVEFEDRWKYYFKYNKENHYNEEELIEDKRQYLCLKIRIDAIGGRNAITRAQDKVDRSLNILRMIFKTNIQASGYVERLPKFNSADGYSSVHSSLQKDSWSALGRFEEYYEERIKELSKIFNVTKPSDLQQRIRESIIAFGIAMTIRYNQYELILLCSALEVLVVDEYNDIGQKIAVRTSDLLKTNKPKIIGDLRELYRKRSSIIHESTKDEVTKDDVDLMSNYVTSTISEMIKLTKMGFKTLHPKKGTKSLANEFCWISSQ